MSQCYLHIPERRGEIVGTYTLTIYAPCFGKTNRIAFIVCKDHGVKIYHLYHPHIIRVRQRFHGTVCEKLSNSEDQDQSTYILGSLLDAEATRFGFTEHGS